MSIKLCSKVFFPAAPKNIFSNIPPNLKQSPTFIFYIQYSQINLKPELILKEQTSTF